MQVPVLWKFIYNFPSPPTSYFLLPLETTSFVKDALFPHLASLPLGITFCQHFTQTHLEIFHCGDSCLGLMGQLLMKSRSGWVTQLFNNHWWVLDTGLALKIKDLTLVNSCPFTPIYEPPVNGMGHVLIGTLGDMRSGEQDQASAISGELRDQENTHLCQATRTRNGRKNRESITKRRLGRN